MQKQSYTYGRVANPTRAALEANLAALENAAHAVAFASGVAAADAILRSRLRTGERVLASVDLYGGNRRLLESIYEPAGIQVQFVDMTDLEAVTKALQEPVQTPLGLRRLPIHYCAFWTLGHSATWHMPHSAAVVVGQHVCNALAAEATGPGGRSSAAFDDKVSGRTL